MLEEFKYCLDEGTDSDLISFRDVLRRFVAGAQTIRSVDGFLVQLGVLVFEVEELLGKDAERVGSVVKKLLACREVVEALRPLTRYTKEVKHLVTTDPRHRSLRPYLEDLLKLLESIPPSVEVKHLEIRRPSLPELEVTHKEEAVRPLRTPTIFEEYTREADIPKKESSNSKNTGTRKKVGLILLIVVLMLLITYVLPHHTINYTTSWSFFTINYTTSWSFFSSAGAPRKLVLNNTHITLVMEGRPYGWLKMGDTTVLYLTPEAGGGSELLSPDYLFVNSTHGVMVYSARRIVSALRRVGMLSYVSTYKVLTREGYVCHFSISIEEKIIPASCTSVLLLVRPDPHIDLLEAVMYGYNTTTLEIIRKEVLGGKLLSNEETLRRVLSWLEKNTEYDYEKAEATSFSVLTPLQFLKVRKGVCSDYAVFTAAALLAGGFKEVFIVIINTSVGWHATAGVVLNEMFLVADQRLPPIEWGDYIEYWFKPVGEVQVLKIRMDRNTPVVEGWVVNPRELIYHIRTVTLRI